MLYILAIDDNVFAVRFAQALESDFGVFAQIGITNLKRNRKLERLALQNFFDCVAVVVGRKPNSIF